MNRLDDYFGSAVKLGSNVNNHKKSKPKITHNAWVTFGEKFK